MKLDHPLPSHVEIIDREKYIIQRAKGKKVLHLGCVDRSFLGEKLSADRWLHKKLVDVGQNVVGLDNDDEGIEKLREIHPDMKFIVANVEELEEIGYQEEIDLIIGGEIIEHLANVGNFLTKIQLLMSPDTILILTTPNAFRYQNMILSFFKRESIHADHNYWFSWNSLKTVLNKFGLHIEKTLVANIHPKVVFKQDDSITRKIQKLGFGIIDTLITKLIIPFVPFWSDTLIVEVKKGSSVEGNNE